MLPDRARLFSLLRPRLPDPPSFPRRRFLRGTPPTRTDAPSFPGRYQRTRWSRPHIRQGPYSRQKEARAMVRSIWRATLLTAWAWAGAAWAQPKVAPVPGTAEG